MPIFSVGLDSFYSISFDGSGKNQHWQQQRQRLGISLIEIANAKLIVYGRAHNFIHAFHSLLQPE